MKFTIAIAVVILLVGICQAAYLPRPGSKRSLNLGRRRFNQMAAKRNGGQGGHGQGSGEGSGQGSGQGQGQGSGEGSGHEQGQEGGNGEFYEPLFTPAIDIFWTYLGKCGEVYGHLAAQGLDMSAIEDKAPTVVDGCELAFGFYFDLEDAENDEKKAEMIGELEDHFSDLICLVELSNAELWALKKGGPTAEEHQAYELAKGRCDLDLEEENEGSEDEENTGPPNKRSKLASVVSKLRTLLKKEE